ncbi:calcium-binding protein [Phenylobacterium soli]
MGGGTLSYSVTSGHTATLGSGFEGDANIQLTKTGAGTLVLSAASDFNTLTVSGGVLQVDATLASAATTVQSGGTLHGVGTIGALTVQSGGIVSAGDSPGTLNTGAVTLASGSTLQQEFGWGGQYDQLHVTGTVNLGGATLTSSILSGFSAAVGAHLTIIDNDGADAITGTFSGLAEGASLSAAGFSFTISYVGGDGNDAVLTVTAAPVVTPVTPPTTGGEGADTVFLDNGANTYSALGGADLVYGGDGTDTLQGNAGADTLDGGAGDDILRGGKDEDLLLGGYGADRLFGDLGADTLQGGAGADTLDGGDSNDALRGGQDNDLLLGGAGDDRLWGDKGSDTLTGGAGADQFHIGAGGGADLVTDFHLSEGDRVVVDGGLSWSVAQAGADTVVTLSDGATLTLAGVTASTLATGWILAG